MLSAHLTEAEFLTTRHAGMIAEQRRIWDGTPSLKSAACRFAVDVFEPIRQLVGPLHVNSGYRCPALNAVVGGAAHSRHMLALAADIVPLECELERAMAVFAAAVRAGGLRDVDQVIIECGTWIHVQAAPAGTIARRQILLSTDGEHFALYPQPTPGGTTS